LKFNLGSVDTKILKGEILHSIDESIPEFNTIEVDVLFIKNKQENSIISTGLIFNAYFNNLQRNVEVVSILGEYSNNG
jgi:hypothetical protein